MSKTEKTANQSIESSPILGQFAGLLVLGLLSFLVVTLLGGLYLAGLKQGLQMAQSELDLCYSVLPLNGPSK
jgi:hypothetical protein